jgi:hypothetical protein
MTPADLVGQTTRQLVVELGIARDLYAMALDFEEPTAKFTKQIRLIEGELRRRAVVSPHV